MLQYPVQVLDNEFGRMWYKKDKKFHMPKGKRTRSPPTTVSCVKPVPIWVNLCFTNLVWSVQRTWSGRTRNPPITVSCVKPVLNWVNLCFTNLVWSVQWTWKRCGKLSLFLIGQTFTSWTCFGQFDKLPWSYVLCPKSFAEHALGIFAQFGEPCLWLVLRVKRALLWMRQKGLKIDDDVNISLVSEGTDLFVDLWDAHPCLCDPERYSS